MVCRLVVLVTLTVLAAANATVAGAGATLRVDPARILLRGANRVQQLLITERAAHGGLRDATRTCTLEIADGRVARVDGARVEGVADGSTTLVVTLGERRVEVPVVVEDFDRYPPVHFENDVIPIFTKLGCNSGACHGKASGQNGFKLSVFSFDPAADYDALTKESRGRRVVPASPERSLLIAKPSARVPHGGGGRLEAGSSDWETLRNWIRQGMPWGADDAPRLVSIEVLPPERVLDLRSSQQILVTAVYSDGGRRDATSATTYTTNFEPVATVDEEGLVQTGGLSGEAVITVNYMGQVAAVHLQVPRPDRPAQFPDLPVNNRIDELVWKKLEKVGVLPSALSDDATFLRRASLDTIGRPPTPEAVRRFLADSAPDKRARLVDSLLERDEFADLWALKWADILLVDSWALGERGAFEFHYWLRRQFARNRPYDEWVRELVTATGNSAKQGPVNFFRALRSPEELARSISQAFLGVRLECAQCHHHPFEKWSREDFYGMVGFFNGIERKALPGGRELVWHGGLRETRIPFSNRLIATRPLDGPPLQVSASDDAVGRRDGGDPRIALARWVTAPENPWFAKLAVNRVWKHFLGRGIVDPEDDLRTTNPPTNPELLEFLERSFVDSGYNLRTLMRLILTSRVYQLSSTPHETGTDDNQNFSHYYVKRLPAEILLDAIGDATGVEEDFAGRPQGTRAVELWDNRMPSYFLEIFGRPARNSPCECGRVSEPTIAQALHLMNAPEIEARIGHADGRVARLVASGASSDEIASELCLAALGRLPGESEQRVARELFASAPRREAAEDFLWTLLNSYDFIFVR